MTVDFNAAPEQGSGAGPIPEDSVVVVVAEIREPKAGKQGTANPLFAKAASGYEFLDFEFTVVSPKFKDRKIWQNFMLAYTKAPTEKSNQAISISMRTLRAMVEAARKISPKDTSPEATKARSLAISPIFDSMLLSRRGRMRVGKPERQRKAVSQQHHQADRHAGRRAVREGVRGSGWLSPVQQAPSTRASGRGPRGGSRTGMGKDSRGAGQGRGRTGHGRRAGHDPRGEASHQAGVGEVMEAREVRVLDLPPQAIRAFRTTAEAELSVPRMIARGVASRIEIPWHLIVRRGIQAILNFEPLARAGKKK